MSDKSRKVVTIFDDYYEMMSDRVRMDGFRSAILSCVKPGDVVVDLGSGPGILSFFALKAGAAKVYAIEKSDSIRLAEEVARVNGYSGKIVFINKNSKDTVLDEPVDVIVSETLGSFAIDENTLEFTIDARNRFLKKEGKLLPESLSLFLVPVESYSVYKKMLFWKDIQGIDFSPALTEISRRLMIEEIRSENYLSEPKLFKELDLYSVKSATVENKINYTLHRQGTVHGLAGWFKVALYGTMEINTSPSSKSTHWKQAFFPLKNPINVIKGDLMEVSMRISPKPEAEDGINIDYDCFCTQKAKEIDEKVGRNEPCPCGSGRKYKKCCSV